MHVSVDIVKKRGGDPAAKVGGAHSNGWQAAAICPFGANGPFPEA
jgi:hypothetical protein